MALSIDRIRQRGLLSAFLVAFLDNFGLSIVFILFAPLLLNPSYGFFSQGTSEGVKNILLGLLLGSFSICIFFGAPFWGEYADRFGRKKAFVITLLGTIAGHLLSAVGVYLESYVFLLVSRAIAGFFSGNISICLAAVSDLSPQIQKKARNFGLMLVFMGMGWNLAMISGGYLSDPTLLSFFSPAVPFIFAAFLTLIGYGIVQYFFIETHAYQRGAKFDLLKSIHDIKDAIKFRKMRPYFLVLLFWTLGWFFVFQWFAAVGIELFAVTQERISLYLVVSGSFWVIGGLVLNPFLVKKFSSQALATVGSLVMCLFIALAALSESFLFFSLFVCGASLVGAISLSNILNLVSNSASEKIQGKVMGFTQAFQALGAIIVPFLGGLLAKIDIHFIFPVASTCLFFTALILLFPHEKLQKETKS